MLFFHETRIKTGEIQLERRYKTALPVLCMPGEIQQVFTNLIGNALDALSAHGRLIVAIRPLHNLAGGESVRVTIADTGTGMDKETLDQLFRPFFTTKGEVGTGLGLWVSKGILENHRADLTVRSKRGRGTVFQLSFSVELGAERNGSLKYRVGIEASFRLDQRTTSPASHYWATRSLPSPWPIEKYRPYADYRSWRRYAVNASRSSCFRSTAVIPPLVILPLGVRSSAISCGSVYFWPTPVKGPAAAVPMPPSP